MLQANFTLRRDRPWAPDKEGRSPAARQRRQEKNHANLERSSS